MAKRRKSGDLIDGFTALKAVRDRQVKAEPEARSKSGAAPRKARRKQPPHEIPGAKRTALPTKHKVRCYECQYEFVVAGRITDTGCPKCHATLTASDLVIDKEWRKSLFTIGMVHVKTDGVIKGGDVICQDLIVEGGIEGGTICAGGRLELHAGSKVDLSAVDACDLLILEGVRIASTKKLYFRNIEVRGELNAKLVAEGTTIVRSGGLLRGHLQGEHLQVEDGAGLLGHIDIHGSGEDESEDS